MISNAPEDLLFLHPGSAPSAEPVVDELTRKLAGAWTARRVGHGEYRGYHDCSGYGCLATSDRRDHYVMANGRELKTNSLAIHYLAYHRDDVPRAELKKVKSLIAEEAQPKKAVMRGWNGVRGKRLTGD